jgi:hypothetical protein
MAYQGIQKPQLGEILMFPRVLPVEGELAHEIANHRLTVASAKKSSLINGTYVNIIPFLLVLLAI